jgi:glycine/D-amino acid oxidase-like deaminating enzyme
MTSSPGEISLWWASLDEVPDVRAPLDGDADVDVAIVGGGFTGLWTALSLVKRDPAMRVLVLEAERCGFGASGRNGGWASALFAASDARLVREHGVDAARRMRRAMNESIDEIARSADDAGIDCRLDKGGTIHAARSDAQLVRARAELDEARALGVDEDLVWLDADEASAVLGATEVRGATYTPNCAALDPARLVVGLAEAAERSGVRIVEQTPALAIVAGSASERPTVRTAAGTVCAEVVVRATEGWSSQLEGSRRSVLPVYSLMIATEPLPDRIWGEIGLHGRETFADHRNLIIYGQRTRDGRLAFGGRGAPYHLGSKISPSFDRDPKVFAALHAALVELFPSVADAEITHRWGGPLGIPRDWHSSVGLDHGSGLAWAGGYVGDGVTTTNLAGRTLADLITGTESDLVTLPWVNHRSPAWEPEPLRWLGVNAGLLATRWADSAERRRGRPSRVAAGMSSLLGG